MLKIAAATAKGGVGKTATICSLAGEFSVQGKKVLIVDMDVQGNLTNRFEIEEEADYTLADVVKNPDRSINRTICKTEYENIDIIPGGEVCREIEMYMRTQPDGERRYLLKNAFEKLKGPYEAVLFDCGPAMITMINQAVLQTVDYLLCPAEANGDSVEGYRIILRELDEARRYGNPDLDIAGIFLVRYRDNIAAHKIVRKMAKDAFGDYYIDTPILFRQDISTAAELKKPICYYRPNSESTACYRRLYKQIMKRIGKRGDVNE